MNQSIVVVDKEVELDEINQMAKQTFGDMVKGVADIKQGIMALGGELRADEEAILLEQGSNQADLWGFNLYPDEYGQDGWIEFDSMINIRPSQGNRSRTVEDPETQKLIRAVIDKLVQA